jgi:hypothetical protein
MQEISMKIITKEIGGNHLVLLESFDNIGI